jgi:hypothetical protein
MNRETRGMFGAPLDRALDRDVFQRRVKFGKFARAEIQNVPGQSANPGSRFDYRERAGRA